MTASLRPNQFCPHFSCFQPLSWTFSAYPCTGNYRRFFIVSFGVITIWNYRLRKCWFDIDNLCKKNRKVLKACLTISHRVPIASFYGLSRALFPQERDGVHSDQFWTKQSHFIKERKAKVLFVKMLLCIFCKIQIRHIDRRFFFPPERSR